jgi:aminoglycoside phosphotransferase (APT) family kinase protein
MTLTEDCLPPHLRTATTTITRIAAGLSGAGVYRVEAAGQVFVLKVAGDGESDADWRGALEVQRLAAEARLTPRIVHVNEGRRAVLTDFVMDRSFIGLYRDPRTHAAAIELLAHTVKRIHALAIPAGARRHDARQFLAQISAGLGADYILPDFASQVIRRALTTEPPPGERPLVMGHNDLNPTNLVYDGEAIVLLDWAMAGAIDPFFDLATITVFLRMDEGTCLRLLSAYDGAPVGALPAPFIHMRRLMATLAGTASLSMARRLRHAGASGTETLETTLPLADFYQQLRSGTLALGTPDGHWMFGLALLKESLAI